MPFHHCFICVHENWWLNNHFFFSQQSWRRHSCTGCLTYISHQFTWDDNHCWDKVQSGSIITREFEHPNRWENPYYDQMNVYFTSDALIDRNVFEAYFSVKKLYISYIKQSLIAHPVICVLSTSYRMRAFSIID